jgi:hypothetical protein
VNNKSLKVNKNYLIILLVACLVILGSIYLGRISVHKEGRNLLAAISVDVVDKDTNVYRTVYASKSQNFQWDEKKKLNKLCVGESAAQNYKTICEVADNKIHVLHYIDQQIHKTHYICLYVNFDTNECMVGDQENAYISEESIYQKHSESSH